MSDPDLAEAHYNLGFTLSNLGDFEGALLGEVVARLRGKPWAEVLQERVLDGERHQIRLDGA